MFLRAVLALSLLALGMSAGSGPAAAQNEADFTRWRKEMVEKLVAPAGVSDPRVLQTLQATPRHEFVAAPYRRQAYFDMALPIGEQQTISSPFIVAYMTQALDPQPTDKVLEIGTGSGYQAAILSPLVKEVYTIEIVESLGQRAARTLRRLGYENVYPKVGDGFQGWPAHAPFDKIIVTCSPEQVPQPLIDQLREGGLMVIPVGERYQQTLYLMRKRGGKLEAEALQPTLFVPMTGRAEEHRKIQPDPLRPQIVNGGFEEGQGEGDAIPGWYYERQHASEHDASAPQGERIVTFRNREPGQAAHLMQGFAIDGARVRELELSTWVRYRDVALGRHREEIPSLSVSFYDGNREDLGFVSLGPFHGDSAWRKVAQTVQVPPQAKEGIVRIGLFGATGEISFDDVQMMAKRK